LFTEVTAVHNNNYIKPANLLRKTLRDNTGDTKVIVPDQRVQPNTVKYRQQHFRMLWRHMNSFTSVRQGEFLAERNFPPGTMQDSSCTERTVRP